MNQLDVSSTLFEVHIYPKDNYWAVVYPFSKIDKHTNIRGPYYAIHNKAVRFISESINNSCREM